MEDSFIFLGLMLPEMWEKWKKIESFLLFIVAINSAPVLISLLLVKILVFVMLLYFNFRCKLFIVLAVIAFSVVLHELFFVLTAHDEAWCSN